jgi:hypothetical protein
VERRIAHGVHADVESLRRERAGQGQKPTQVVFDLSRPRFAGRRAVAQFWCAASDEQLHVRAGLTSNPSCALQRGLCIGRRVDDRKNAMWQGHG